MNWETRIKNAEKHYKAWENRFQCATLEEYYEGKQWRNVPTGPSMYSPYVFNLVFSTIAIKMSSILLQKPTYIISPRPGNSDWNQEIAIKSATLKQDVLNTLIQNPRSKFAENIKLAALDSFFRFGMLEVGYAADWRNPLKTRPLMKSDKNPDEEYTNEEDKVVEDPEVPMNERMYFKRIKSRRFRVSASDSEFLEGCDWFGYYDYYYKSQLEKNKDIKLPKDYVSKYTSVDAYIEVEGDSKDRDVLKNISGHVCKVWHIWNNITHKRVMLLADTHDEVWESEEEFDSAPLIDLRWNFRLDGFYPIPPVYNWISPQNEINEAREQMRSYRRRFTRKYQVRKGMIDEEEKEKFASGPDGVVIETKNDDGITPILNPETGASLENALIIGKDEFNIVSGTSSEQRGSADRTTATQAKIVDARMSIRESAEQIDFSKFLTAIGRATLIHAAENMSTQLWIKYSQDVGDKILEEYKVNQPVYELVTAQQIDDGYDFEINIEVFNESPMQLEIEKRKFIEFLALINQFPQVTLSPLLIRETAYRVGYRNEKIIAQMQKAALLNMMGAVGIGGQGNSNNIAKGAIAQASPNTGEEVQSQLEGQL